MSEEPVTDDQSHYEVSLTAGQAFLAFVLLLLSLAASFAFGLMIGRGHEDDRLLAQNSPTIVDEASAVKPAKKAQERIVELGITEESFSDAEPAPQASQPANTAVSAPPARIEEAAPEVKAPVTAPPASGPAVPHYAQLLSTADQKKAEAFAAKLIDGGFPSAYVDRTTGEKGMLFRVRVNFPSEQAARTAEAKLRTFSREVWITRQ